MSSKNFKELGLSKPVLRALDDCGYSIPTPIQEMAIPIVMSGKDLIATAQTGTGKTAAFTLPLIDDIGSRESGQGDPPLVLILTPTRELALQIDENIKEYGKYVGSRTCVVLGGVSSAPQIKALQRGVDFLVATPGRLIDLIEQGEVILEEVEFLILDEADRMLDMGFVHDVRWIADQVPRPRQTLLFSATMSAAVKSLASTMQTDAEVISVAPPATVADNIDQQVMYVEKEKKNDLLLHLLQGEVEGKALVFTGKKTTATMVATYLERNKVSAVAIHSNKTQKQRQKALEAFTNNKARVLVATDIVARGIDVEGITHVINYEMPEDAENYVHRIGRTARAGAKGVAIALCSVPDISYLRSVELLTKMEMNTIDDQPFHSEMVAGCKVNATRAAKSRARAGRGRGSGSKWRR
ncbi:MAG: DEAD/DEAH box helicase [bacterium]|nr:DEAD/DEAH box helicase [bacterium]